MKNKSRKIPQKYITEISDSLHISDFYKLINKKHTFGVRMTGDFNIYTKISRHDLNMILTGIGVSDIFKTFKIHYKYWEESPKHIWIDKITKA